MTDITKKYMGGMVGSALGDAIGELAFRYRNKEDLCLQIDRLEELRYTDDTAMSIGIAESLIKKVCLDQQDLVFSAFKGKGFVIVQFVKQRSVDPSMVVVRGNSGL